ncbi:MAG: carboxypeptidase regulatory-like domain-containing protein [Proteobacteria bacterium]|nr:carboxypeptidase regulatory-like domain-containing protein [Pseudomonadota bacterium]
MSRVGKLFVSAALALLSFNGWTQTLSPEIMLGASWLQSQIRSDGTLANESASIARSLQIHAEVLTTLQTLGVTPPSPALSALAAQIDNAVDTNLVEPLARQAIAHQQMQTGDAAIIAAMMTQRNSDNGFGAIAEFGSNALDTAWLLMALGQSASYDRSAVSTALGFLAQSKQTDGGWSIDNSSAVYLTSLAGQAAGVWSSRFQTGAISTASQNWLLSKRNASLHFGNTFDNACALLALSMQTAQTAVIQPIVDALKATQLSNGSWDNDPYLTALALRALWVATQPPTEPTTGDIQGRVVDYDTGSAIVGANVSLKERSQSSADSASNGTFALSGIPEGNYTLRVVALGYQSIESEITVTAGQILNLGTIRLTAAPLTASLSGVARNSGGAALANVVISVGVNSAITNSSGAYQLTGLDVGPTTITASLSGYRTVTTDITFEPGQSYLFSPTMYSTGQTPTTGDIQGKVVDDYTGAPIVGANVSLKERYQSSVNTTSDGFFALSGVPAGTYTVRVAAAGYQSVESTVTIADGQLLNLGTIRLTKAPLTASLSGIVKNSSGTTLANVAITVGAVSVLTNSSGAYLITDLEAGPAAITASLANYRTVTADVNFEAGVNYVFSPTLYLTSVTPPATSLKGKVVDSANQALAGVTVALTLSDGTQAPPQTTAVAGTFQFDNLAAVGQIQLTLTASGYQTAVLSGTLVNGVNDVGNIVLTLSPTGNTLNGTVTDAASGAPIADALIAVQGQIAEAVSGNDGHYTLSGIGGTDFVLLISASGYLSQTLQVHLNQPGEATLDIQLAQPAASGITIESATPDKPSYKPNDEVSIMAGIFNASGSPAALLISAQVFDEQHNLVYEMKANARGLGQNPPNLPLVFPGGTLQSVKLEELLFRQPAGNYTAHVLAADGSGRVLAERDAAFTVEAMPLLAGGVSPNPPLAQIGTQQPIQITADLTNVGNRPVPPGTLDLKIVLDNPDTQVSTALQTVVNSRASGAPLNNSRGLIADDEGNLYTVNYGDAKLIKIAPDGTMSVVATLPGNGNTDLARDHDDNLWVTTVGSKLYEVTPAGIVVTYTLTTLSYTYGIDVAADGSLLITGTIGISGATENRLIKRDVNGVETVLWRNGLSNPVSLVKDDVGHYVVTNYGDNTLSKVATDGSITTFVSGLNRPQGITRDAAGNFYVANSGDGTIVKVTPGGATSVYATGFNQPTDLKFDGSGNLFVSNQGDDTILKVLPNGVVEVFAQGIAKGPQGMKYDAAGNLWIANSDGTLRMKNPQDEVTVVATGLSSPYGLALDAAGNALIANYSGGTVTRVSNGVKSTFASGLSNPYGVAIRDNGDAYVTEYGANRISRFDGSGNSQGIIESILVNPSQVRVGTNGEVYVVNSNFITVVENGVPRKLTSGFTANYIAPDPVNGGLIAISSRDIYRIDVNGVQTKLGSVVFNPYGVGVDASGNILVADSSGKQIVKLDSGGTVSPFAALSKNPSTLVTDFNGRIAVRYSDYTLAVIDGNGTESPLALSVGGTVNNLGIGADGKLLVAIYNSGYKAYSVDRDTGAASLVLALTMQLTDLAGDAIGGVYTTYSGAQDLRHYDSSGTQQSTLSGFVGPCDIVWDGSVFWFSDNGSRLYTLMPGAYPVKQSDAFYPRWLAIQNGALFGVYSNTIYQWNGSVQSWASFNGLNFTGIAARADGTLTVGDSNGNRVVTVGSDKSIIADYAGLNRPQGLAFDALGRLYVANNGSGAVMRFDGITPTTLARISASLQYLAFDSRGILWTTTGGVQLYKIAADGTTATVIGSNAFNGLLLDGSQWIFVDRGNSQLRRYDGTNWTLFATGLSGPQGVRALPNGDIAVASRNNNAVVRYSNGTLTTIANNLAGLNKLGLDASGRLYTAADGGVLSRIEADGSAIDIDGVVAAVYRLPLYGIAPTPDGSLYVLPPSVNTIYRFTIEQAATPPAAGTVVYQTSLPMAALPPEDQYANFDFGSWLLPYGGDFRIEVSRAGVEGVVTNFVHVGGAANSTLVALKDQLPPGDQILPMCMKLSGADFTSISRVETGQVRRLVGSGWPSGMAADRAGTLYYTSPTAFNRVAPDGTITTVADGMSLAFGLAADSNENFYMPSKNATTSRFELIKIDLDGNKTVVADLGVTQANGVQVDSRDDILVGSPNKLLKVDKDTSAVSVVATAGLPQPRGLAIDANDNVYVQNEDHYVSMIRPDGSSVVIFSKGDGTVDPYFEGDGFPNITGDCGGNFYIATFTWARINQTGEEHTLAQVVPRTGQISLMLDTRTISPNLSDIDYISYDRFGRRILMFNDGGRDIWQAPVTCGAIGVDVHLLAKPGQDLSGASRTPNAVVPHADGRTEYVWSLENVTVDGEQICFDASQQNLQLGELRKTLDSGFMSFKNSFAPGDVTVPFDVPNVLVANLIGLTVATDAADYPANSVAQVTTTLNNTDVLRTIGGTLNVQVFDAKDALVGSVTRQGVTLLPGEELPVTAPFAIGTIVPARYTVKAVLTDNDLDLAQAVTTFNVLAHNQSASAVSALSVDKRLYNPSDQVIIASRAQSRSMNLILDNLTLMVKVFDSSGAQIFSHGHSIDVLLPVALRDFTATEVLNNVPSGVYTVEQDLLDNQLRVLDHNEATYLVGSTRDSGFGLTGAIVADPNSLRIGETVNLTASVTNLGNSGVTDLPLTIYIVDPDLGNIVARFDQTSNIIQGGSVPFNTPWATTGRVGATYLTVLAAAIGSGADAVNMPLAQDRFTLLAQIAAGITATGGTPQSATVSQAYPIQLEATVRDTAANPISGVTVTFAAPTTGQSITFPGGNTAVTGSDGRARVSVVANNSIGAFNVTATAPGVAGAATFQLENKAALAASITATGGTPQSAEPNAIFANTLQATVLDSQNAPIENIPVTFTAPAGTGIAFPNGNTAVTNASGQTETVVAAGNTEGDVIVTATAAGVNGAANFYLRILAPRNLTDIPIPGLTPPLLLLLALLLMLAGVAWRTTPFSPRGRRAPKPSPSRGRFGVGMGALRKAREGASPTHTTNKTL